MAYLNQSARRGTLLRVSLLIIGMQVLIIGLGQAGLTAYGYFPVDLPGMMLIVVEALLGTGMLFFARRLKYCSPGAEAQEKSTYAYSESKDRIGLDQ